MVSTGSKHQLYRRQMYCKSRVSSEAVQNMLVW